MLFSTQEDRATAAAIGKLVYCNPFVPERIGFERAALGPEFVPQDAVWNYLAETARHNPNVGRLGERAEAVADASLERLAAGQRGSAQDLQSYEELVFYVLYHRARDRFEELIEGRVSDGAGGAARGRPKVGFYAEFERDAEHFLAVPGYTPPTPFEPAHLFACCFQIRRAFHHTFRHIVGRSMAAARLRAAVWQSIFTHDLRRYFRALYDRMGDMTTLITGPSGTGKELVARAIGLSRYIPFDPRTKTFAEDFSGATFHALNLSALSPTLIESELFGHRRGAFTGALEDRAGWLEVCPALGTVFLDEVGELDPVIQVKLLRVLQTRTFQRLGDTASRQFRGKLIAATNRDLAREMAAGRFREDFYYRICSDMITTPTLREQLGESGGADGSEGELRSLVLFIARQLAGEGAEAEAAAQRLADEVEAWVEKRLGRDYPWAGNFRELEQCVRNVLIRKEYHPPPRHGAGSNDPAERLAEELRGGKLTADELLRRYCTIVYGQTRNYEETARRLGLDRRTVKSKVNGAADDRAGNGGA